jgi:hypothetical protein
MKEVEKKEIINQLRTFFDSNTGKADGTHKTTKDYFKHLEQLIIAMIKTVDDKIKANKDIGNFQFDHIEKTVSNTRIATLEELKTKLIDIIKRGNNE